MTKQALQIAVPKALAKWYQAREKNPVVAQEKAQTWATLSLRHESIRSQMYLGTMLVALRRFGEALSVLRVSYAEATYRGSKDAWHRAALCCAAASLIRRKGEGPKSAKWDEGMDRFVTQPSHALLSQSELWTGDRFRAEKVRAWKRFEVAVATEDVLVGVEEGAEHIADLTFLRVMTLVLDGQGTSVWARHTKDWEEDIAQMLVIIGRRLSEAGSGEPNQPHSTRKTKSGSRRV